MPQKMLIVNFLMNLNIVYNEQIKILTQYMPRYTIIEQPLQYENTQRLKRSQNVQDPVYVQRLRQILQHNRKNNQYYTNDSNQHPVRLKEISSQRYETEKSDNEEEVVYVIKDNSQLQNNQSGVHLPKIRRRQKLVKPTRYSHIDNNQKLIIRNYMNAKLIEFKSPRKSPKKRRNHTLDSVGELPDNPRKKYYKYQVSTPIQSLNRVSSNYKNGEPNQIISRTNTVDYHNLNNGNANSLNLPNYKRHRTPSSVNIRSEQQSASMRRSIVNQFSDSAYNKDQNYGKFRHKTDNNETSTSPEHRVVKPKQQGWQLVDPLNLQTYFVKMKKISNISPQNSKMQKTKIKIPKIPAREQMSSFIKNYVPQFDEIKIQELIKADTFQIIQDQTAGQVSFYFGQTQNDKKNGKGILLTEKFYFQGIWANDLKSRGIEVSELGKYKGQFKDGVRSGKGQFFWSHGEYYSGQWKNGKKNGSGYWRSLKGQSYMGEWKNGQVTGYGVHTMKSGQKYEGEFVNFLKHGFGKQVFPNGDNYQGRYVQAQAHGKGKYTWKNGTIYEGQFIEGYRQGKGIITAPNHLKFEGTFKDQLINGMGRLESSNGDVFNGMFENNKKNGHGILDLKQERRIIKGIWKNNQLLKEQE